jgi:hypothetical protein
MVLKNALAAVICVGVFAGVGPALADAYKADEFLSLDLKAAVLSPKRIGPPAQFEQVPVAAKADPEVQVTHPRAQKRQGIVHAAIPRPAPTARTKLVRRHSNPLDAQASDTRIQVWPCKSGGICNWQR